MLIARRHGIHRPRRDHGQSPAGSPAAPWGGRRLDSDRG